MSIVKKPLQPHDSPVNAEGEKIKKQDGTSIANTHDPKTLQIGLTTTKPAARKISGLPEATPGPRSAVCHAPWHPMPRSSFVVKITGIAPEVHLAHYVRATPYGQR